MTENNDCPIHSGQHNDSNREWYEEKMIVLQENQGGKGRHKCPYCAYNRGYEDAKNNKPSPPNLN